MQTKLTGHFLVNGSKCQLSIDKDSIKWTKLSNTSNRSKNISNEAARDQNEVHMINEKCIAFNQVVGTRCKYNKDNTSNQNNNNNNSEKRSSTTNSSDISNDGKHKCKSSRKPTTATCNKIKLYYSKSDDNNTKGRLLKLKKVTFRPMTKFHPISSSSSSSSSSFSSSALSNSTDFQQQDAKDCNEVTNKQQESSKKSSSTNGSSGASSSSNSATSENESNQLSFGSLSERSNTSSPVNEGQNNNNNENNQQAQSELVGRQNSKQNCDNQSNTNSTTSQIGINSYSTQSLEHENDDQMSLLRQEFKLLHQKIEDALKYEREKRPQRLLVFVNPFGGKGRALNVYKRQVRKLLELSQVEIKLVITKHANHARDTIEDPQFNVEYFDGIVCVGGDGMFSELMNGLLFRYNREKIHQSSSSSFSNYLGNKSDKTINEPQEPNVNPINISTESYNQVEVNKNNSITTSKLTNLKSALGGIGEQFESPLIPIGVIGAGSTDANSFGLIGTNDAVTATLNIILGNLIDIDVCSIHTFDRDRLLKFVSTFVAYGYFGDVIKESERLRWLGPSRYDLSGLSNLIKNRSYKGQINILCSPSDGSPNNMKERCHKNCKLCMTQSSSSNVSTKTCSNGDDQEQQQQQHQRNLNELNLEIIERTGSFVGVNAAVTACRCPQTKKGFSPANHLANGCADLILVRPCSRLQYIQYLMRTGWTKKSPFDLKYVEAYRCRQFEFVAQLSNKLQQAAVSRTDKLDYNTKKSPHSSGVSSASSSSSSSSSTQQDSNMEKTSERLKESLLSSWNVDGEILEEQSIRVKVNNQLLRVFGTGEPQMVS